MKMRGGKGKEKKKTSPKYGSLSGSPRGRPQHLFRGEKKEGSSLKRGGKKGGFSRSFGSPSGRKKEGRESPFHPHFEAINRRKGKEGEESGSAGWWQKRQIKGKKKGPPLQGRRVKRNASPYYLLGKKGVSASSRPGGGGGKKKRGKGSVRVVWNPQKRRRGKKTGWRPRCTN